jgi:hypothetical protein
VRNRGRDFLLRYAGQLLGAFAGIEACGSRLSGTAELGLNMPWL